MTSPLDNRRFSDSEIKEAVDYAFAKQRTLATRTIGPLWPIELTPMQKLHALSGKFYSRLQWEPKAGDLYTTSRADLELYQVTAIRDGKVFTRYRDGNRSIATSEWPEDEFLDPHTFGYARVHVPDWIIFNVDS